jgi:hypothetical protein
VVLGPPGPNSYLHDSFDSPQFQKKRATTWKSEGLPFVGRCACNSVTVLCMFPSSLRLLNAMPNVSQVEKVSCVCLQFVPAKEICRPNCRQTLWHQETWRGINRYEYGIRQVTGQHPARYAGPWWHGHRRIRKPPVIGSTPIAGSTYI